MKSKWWLELFHIRRWFVFWREIKGNESSKVRLITCSVQCIYEMVQFWREGIFEDETDECILNLDIL